MAATFTRNNAWDNGGTLEGNSDLLWYAIGVGKMMQRSITDPKSWWYFGAIHGDGPEWGGITAPPQVPPLPSPDLRGWSQCQHATWYFPPWHRGYLIALENQVREDIISLGGPSSWALPYWNYFGQQNPPDQFNIPPAFLEQNFPQAAQLPPNVPPNIPGSPNPLFVNARYGPNGDGVIFVPTQAGVNAHPQDPNSDFDFGVVTADCLSDTAYTNSFGGGQTGFEHFDSATGDLENNPHNLVHSYIGGFQGNDQNNEQGLMGDPLMAGLDPVFYLHHANIDRLWAIWNVTLKKDNPNSVNWLFGPTTNGQPDFQMPKDGSWWRFTPSDVTDIGKLNYTYEELSAPTGVVTAAQAFSARLTALRKAPAAGAIGGIENVEPGNKVELMGATQRSVVVNGAGARAPVRLDTGVRNKVVASLQGASQAAPPDRVLLRLDNVVGKIGGVISVYINMPEGGKPAQFRHLSAGSIGLFGLREASEPAGKHGGKGMSFTLDITKVIDQLHLGQAFDLDTLYVSLVPSRAIPESTPITVGRISIYRQAH
ncbi:tyrosinase [Labrys miyagiensis]|uniref:Tyrosinase n=1 Tax=Labrys miyagiensis TaxID=346912 RepID=A0ABQ6CMI7_9HYPH|nr:tyrosinase family protein [Labrys miyagiensis]GLS19919.1 tyrosinase [Labrys miyagiensis]